MSRCSAITYRPLCDQSSVLPINKYNAILKSILVGNLSIYCKGGYINVSCRNVIKEMDLQNTVCIAIRSRVLSLPCYGVYSGIIMASFLERLFHYPVDQNCVYEVTSNLEKIKSFLMYCIEEMKMKCDVDVEILVDSVSRVLATDLVLSSTSLKKLSLEIVKSVVSSMESGTSKLGRIHVIVESEKERFFATGGVICEISDSNRMIVDSLLKIESNKLHHLLLVVEPMTDEYEILIEQMYIVGIKIVVCQKSVSSYLKVMLRRRNILVIERVGEETALSIEQLASAIPVSTLNFDVSELGSMVGHFNKISTLPMKRRLFITIENEGSSVSSLFVSCWMFGQTSNSKDIINECIQLVFSMISRPYLLPGSVVFEEELIHFLTEKPLEDPFMKKCVTWLISVLKELSHLSQTMLDMSSSPNKRVDDCYFLKKNVMAHAIDGIIEIVNIALVVEKHS